MKMKNNGTNIYFIGFYEKILKHLILNLKFEEKPYIATFLSDIIIEKYKDIIRKYDFLIYVPMSEKNKKIRGFNQTELICKNIKQKLEINVLNCLIKIKQNKKQSTLTEKEREKNVIGVYQLTNDKIIKNKKLLLFDDIYTTGSTTNECIKMLRKANPELVDVLVICKSKKG